MAVLGTLGGIVAIFAGVYMISIEAAAANSLLDAIAAGLGAYMIAKGLYMISSTALASNVNTSQRTSSSTEPASAHPISSERSGVPKKPYTRNQKIALIAAIVFVVAASTYFIVQYADDMQLRAYLQKQGSSEGTR